ncbi:type I restriction-modification methylase S subunit [Halopseudomonas bauzanensis]|nr:type I restriction-modification methylase S subunit [Halopseudomonas bauzanensis]
MSQYKPYPAYKDSGVAWLGRMPEHWQVKRLKHIANVQTGVAKGKDNEGKDTIEVPYLRVANVQDGYLSLDDVTTIEIPRKDLARYSLQPGDVLMNEGGDFDKLGRGSVWLGEIEPCIHQNHVFAVRPTAVSSVWLNAFTGSLAAQFYFMGRAKQSTNLASISSSNIMELPVAMPSAIEIDLLLAHLDRETARINALIEKKNRFIELLREKRQALITHAVTKGLDSNVKMKDSGVEWLGQVLEHWNVKRLKLIATVQTGIAKGKDNAGKDTIEVPYLRVANVQDGYLDLREVATIEVSTADLPRYLLQPGDVLMNEGGDFDKLGRGHVWQGEVEPCIHQNHVFAVRPHGVSSEWLSSFASSAAAQFYFMGRSKQSTNLASISSSNLMELVVPLPREEEQHLILAELDRQVTKVKALVTMTEHSIALLKERRSALITAAVTGQIDLREAI